MEEKARVVRNRKRLERVTLEEIESSRLNPIEKTVAEMYYINAMSVREIATERKRRDSTISISLNGADKKIGILRSSRKSKNFPESSLGEIEKNQTMLLKEEIGLLINVGKKLVKAEKQVNLALDIFKEARENYHKVLGAVICRIDNRFIEMKSISKKMRGRRERKSKENKGDEKKPENYKPEKKESDCLDYLEETGRGPDIFRIYSKEISKIPLLSKEEEKQLARKVRGGNGNQAFRDKLIESNLRLVFRDAVNCWGEGFEIIDLIQEGNKGLIRAAEKFDPEKGIAFSTYAGFWIKSQILKYIMDNKSLVRIGKSQAERKLFFSLYKKRMDFLERGVFPSSEMLASSLDVNVRNIVEMEQRFSNGFVYLDEKISGENDTTWGEVISLCSRDELEEEIIRSIDQERMKTLFAEFREGLNERETVIFDQRLLADKKKTLTEIGKRYDLSRERVRQIEFNVKRKLMIFFHDEQ